jgi:hypothetical protein
MISKDFCQDTKILKLQDLERYSKFHPQQKVPRFNLRISNYLFFNKINSFQVDALISTTLFAYFALLLLRIYFLNL